MLKANATILHVREPAHACVVSRVQAAHLAPGHRCPLCASPIYRIRRRVLDRLLSWFTPVHRYQCSAMHCRWEGNLLEQQTTANAPQAGAPLKN
ncbi:hypothetical protein [Niveibacterium sp. COAC-50]|uniref:hypothetical protein n=1 Tax=Niveibacterium sp. COAC-50 TaxID=2729384 RepID=UPI00155500C6|nr:hypothetical protein [Niveibacterium sp. COAC-50]